MSFSNCFHGRTLGSLNLTWKEAYRTPFEPLYDGHRFATYGDLASAESAIVPGETAAVFVEPVQGEGGIYPADAAFLAGLRAICDRAGALLVFDEVQCGLGRTGFLWGHQSVGVPRTRMTVAKPLAGGLPVGAVLCTAEVAEAMAPGDHGSTFAGAPPVCAAANAVYDRVTSPGLMENVRERGEQLRAALREGLIARTPTHAAIVRGSVAARGRAARNVPAGGERWGRVQGGGCSSSPRARPAAQAAPPLVVTEEQVDEAVKIIVDVVNETALIFGRDRTGRVNDAERNAVWRRGRDFT